MILTQLAWATDTWLRYTNGLRHIGWGLRHLGELWFGFSEEGCIFHYWPGAKTLS